jgi:glycerol-3-phosphate acyltransferase PlsY
MDLVVSALIVAVAAFALGSIPFGLLVGKYCGGIDPRSAGSGNVGATNVARLCGFKWGVLTLLLDLLKGFVPVIIFAASDHGLAWLAYAAGLAVICGHMFSVFLSYKGGKGVATTVGVFFALAPWQLVIAGILCLVCIWRTGYVSVGSLVLVGSLPLLFLFSGRWMDMLCALVGAVGVGRAHRDNISRLRSGSEKPWRGNETF